MAHVDSSCLLRGDGQREHQQREEHRRRTAKKGDELPPFPGDTAVLAKLARELVDAEVDVLVTDTTTATVAAHQVSRTIPIVMAAGTDLLALGLAASVSRPGGNITGFSIRPAELMGKRLQLLKYAFPGLTQVAVLINPRQTIMTDVLRNARQAACELHLELTTVEAGDPDALRAPMTSGLPR